MKKYKDHIEIKTTDGLTVTLLRSAIVSVENHQTSVIIYLLKNQGYPDLIYETTMDYRILMQQLYDIED